MKKDLKSIYKILRFFIYLMPLAVIVFGIYVILFPTETILYDSRNPNSSKFEVEKDVLNNAAYFGVAPLLPHQLIDLQVDIKDTEKKKCRDSTPEIALEKTYRAFLFPDGKPIESKEELKDYLYENNTSGYPNGTLLHSKTTDQVFFLTKGRKILFPGPEIFNGFGFSFENLTDVDQQALDQFPEAESKTFGFSMPHPDDTIFKAYPSHKLYLISDGQKREIKSQELLESVWPNYYSVAVSDRAASKIQTCKPAGQGNSGKFECLFNSKLFPESFGKYYSFSIKYTSGCLVQDVHVDKVDIAFVSEKSMETVKNSVKNIFASAVRRYAGK